MQEFGDYGERLSQDLRLLTAMGPIVEWAPGSMPFINDVYGMGIELEHAIVILTLKE